MSIAAISGGTNIIGNTGVVHLNIVPLGRSQRTRVAPQPVPGVHISPEQKAELQALRAEWIYLHNLLKEKELKPGAAWALINRAAGAISYHYILIENFGKAVSFIKNEIGKLRNTPAAARMDPSWRKSHIAAIKARCKNQLGDESAYRTYIKRNFGAESLTELANDELQRTHAYIFAKKR